MLRESSWKLVHFSKASCPSLVTRLWKSVRRILHTVDVRETTSYNVAPPEAERVHETGLIVIQTVVCKTNWSRSSRHDINSTTWIRDHMYVDVNRDMSNYSETFFDFIKCYFFLRSGKWNLRLLLQNYSCNTSSFKYCIFGIYSFSFVSFSNFKSQNLVF